MFYNDAQKAGYQLEVIKPVMDKVGSPINPNGHEK
jgi:hypothetical protein